MTVFKSTNTKTSNSLPEIIYENLLSNFYWPSNIEKLVLETGKVTSYTELTKYTWTPLKYQALISNKVTVEQAGSNKWSYSQIDALNFDGIEAKDVVGKEWTFYGVQAYATGYITPEEAYSNEWNMNQVSALSTGKITAKEALSKSWQLEELVALTFTDATMGSLKYSSPLKLIPCNAQLPFYPEETWSEAQVTAMCSGKVTQEEAKSFNWTPKKVEMISSAKISFENLAHHDWSISEYCCLKTDLVTEQNATKVCWNSDSYSDYNINDNDSFKSCIEEAKNQLSSSGKISEVTLNIYDLSVSQFDCIMSDNVDASNAEEVCLVGEDAGQISA